MRTSTDDAYSWKDLVPDLEPPIRSCVFKLTSSEVNRNGRVYIDHAANGRDRTVVAAMRLWRLEIEHGRTYGRH